MRLLIALILLVGCGRPFWNPPSPTLSDTPLEPGESSMTGLLARILDPLSRDSGSDPIVLDDSTLACLSIIPDGCHFDDAYVLKGLPDSVKAAFVPALRDLERQSQTRHPLPQEARLPPHVRFGGRSTELKRPRDRPITMYVSLSSIGFNEDSTAAVAYRQSWCGPLCGRGIMIFLRRRPGYRWTLWHTVGLWIS